MSVRAGGLPAEWLTGVGAGVNEREDGVEGIVAGDGGVMGDRSCGGRGGMFLGPKGGSGQGDRICRGRWKQLSGRL